VVPTRTIRRLPLGLVMSLRYSARLVRLAILSDIHANLPALEAVLADVESAGLKELWCLGDVVGYGADPDQCTSLVAERCTLCLVGNHDLAVLGELDDSSFSPAAAAAVRWTRETAKPETIEFLSGLKPADESHEVALYHASPRDPVWEYVLWPDQAAECIAAQAARVSLVGHSHVALFFVMPDDGNPTPPLGQTVQPERVAKGAQAGAGTRLDLSEGRWLVNPGSVGQPRDGDPRAAWLELDTDVWEATYHRVEYEIDRAADAIAANELPEHLAKRLYVGQ
jgi:predicted phosphodiesterase